MNSYMFKKHSLICLFIGFVFVAGAQEMIPLNSHLPDVYGESTIEERINYTEDGNIAGISGVTKPSVAVYLPKPENATGTAVIVMPGGAMRFLSWEYEGTKVAEWLNSKGIAAFILKYRLDNSDMQAGQQGNMPAMMMQLTVDQFDQIKNANTNPSSDPNSFVVANNAGDDAMEAIRFVRENASKWGVDVNSVGYLGFSAGGGVALNAVVRSDDKKTAPDFVATIYGPSLIDVVVPKPAPPLFIATAADHMNVAAGCLALFTEWKKVGGEAEIHIYGKGNRAFSGMRKQNLPSDEWYNSFYIWLKSEGF